MMALRWAADFVGPQGVVRAVFASPHGDHAETRVSVEQVRKWTNSIRNQCDHVIDTVTSSEPSTALLDAASDVDVVVIGSRHGPGSALGKLTSELVLSTTRPIVLVPPSPVVELGPTSTVVAGVGHGAATHAALRFAADVADRFGTSLTLVGAVPNRPFLGADGLLDVVAYYIDPSLLPEWAAEDLDEAAAMIQASTTHDVPITSTVIRGSIRRRLVDGSTEASLLVVGRHQDGVLSGRIVPAAVHHAIIRAVCPVVVVPPDDADPTTQDHRAEDDRSTSRCAQP